MCEKKFYAKMQAEVTTMSDYYMGLMIGTTIGYIGSLLTMLFLWSLCIIAKKVDGGRADGAYKENKQ